MSESLIELAERMFVGPVWPASILVCLLVVYTLIATIGLIELDFDLPDADFDLDMADGMDLDLFQGIGVSTLRWINLGRIPIILWAGFFTGFFWIISYGLWHRFDVVRYEPTWLASSLLVARNGVIAVLGTKAVTQPLLKYFVPPPNYDKDLLLGATCEVSSIEATPKFGTAKFRTDAAPLLLNVRTDGDTFKKGDEVRIVAFDPSSRVYTISSLASENHQ